MFEHGRVMKEKEREESKRFYFDRRGENDRSKGWYYCVGFTLRQSIEKITTILFRRMGMNKKEEE